MVGISGYPYFEDYTMPSESKTTFGQMLKKLRLDEAGMGLRAFAAMIEMQPSNLSNIERDRVPPPASRQTVDRICDALGLADRDPRRDQLFDLAANPANRIPADVADVVRQQPGVPVLIRTVGNKQLSEEKLRELAEYIKKHY